MFCDTVRYISSLNIGDHKADGTVLETVQRLLTCLVARPRVQKYRSGFMSLLNLDISLQADWQGRITARYKIRM